VFGTAGVVAVVLVVLFVSRGRGGETDVVTEPVTSSVAAPSETTIETVPPATVAAGQADWDLLARSVVFIEALSPCDWRGSGTIVLDGSYVLTNEHVASSGECPLRVGLTTSLSATPSGSYEARVLVTDKALDLAVLRLVDGSGSPLKVKGHGAVGIEYAQPPLGSRLATLGYPALGSYDAGMTITFTSGTFSGIDYTDGEFFKTDAQMRGGVSGGAAFNERGLLIGIPTGGLVEEDTGDAVGINLIRPVKFAKSLLERAQSGEVGSSPTEVQAPAESADADTGSGSSGGYSGTDPRFGTCKEAIANGYGPYYYGVDPEYDWYIDRDGDGIVCER
jgi:S1-C subfamily serine protease